MDILRNPTPFDKNYFVDGHRYLFSKNSWLEFFFSPDPRLQAWAVRLMYEMSYKHGLYFIDPNAAEAHEDGPKGYLQEQDVLGINRCVVNLTYEHETVHKIDNQKLGEAKKELRGMDVLDEVMVSARDRLAKQLKAAQASTTQALKAKIFADIDETMASEVDLSALDLFTLRGVASRRGVPTTIEMSEAEIIKRLTTPAGAQLDQAHAAGKEPGTDEAEAPASVPPKGRKATITGIDAVP